MNSETRRLGFAWSQGAVVIALLAMGSWGDANAREAESDVEAQDLPVSQSGMGSVAEDELAPTLESNRQPLGPDPLVLPQWTREEVAAFENGRPMNLGGGLWSSERYPLQAVPPRPLAASPTGPAAAGVIGWELMSQYGASTEWCVDPQRVLAATHRSTIEAHLASHARAAYHPVRLWILAPGQSLAASLDEATVHRASFGPERSGVLVVLTPDEPMAARVVVPPALGLRASSWWSGIVARVPPQSPPADQLDLLILWLSVQADALPTLEAVAATPELNVARASARVASQSEAPHRRWWWLAAAAVLALVGMAWRRHTRRRAFASTESPMVWLERECPVRLGGPHSGGSGAVVEW